MPTSKKILYLQFANPAAYPPLEYSARILADKGWKVHLLGVHSDGPHALEFLTHPRIRCDVMPYTPPGWRQKLAYVHFLFHAFKIARNWKPDWLYISDFLAAPVGLLLGKLLGCKMIYHEHDSPAPNAPSGLIRLVLVARKSIACIAEFNILPQAERISLFTKATGAERPVHCVWNCPPKADAQEAAMRFRKPDEPLSVYFHGSINLDRVPLALIEGARRCGIPIRIRLVGYETIGSKGAIEQLRAAARTTPNVALEFPGPVSRCHLRRLMDGMHVGWINFINRSDDFNLLHLVGASNKAFDYLAAGLPIIVPDAPDWRAVFVNPGYARACDAADPEGIASTLRWFYENSALAAEMGEKGRQKVALEWNYETQFGKVLNVLDGEAESNALFAVS
jgi:glycosyltransferase involved in cell wall biosynthesis